MITKKRMCNYIRERSKDSGIPTDVGYLLARYVVYGERGDNFIYSVITNDLMQSCLRANSIRKNNIYGLVMFICNHIPMKCYGNINAYNRWIKNDIYRNDVLNDFFYISEKTGELLHF